VTEQTLANKKTAQLAPATKFVERTVWADKVVGF
jgi:hypothetical protein